MSWHVTNTITASIRLEQELHGPRTKLRREDGSRGSIKAAKTQPTPPPVNDRAGLDDTIDGPRHHRRERGRYPDGSLLIRTRPVCEKCVEDKPFGLLMRRFKASIAAATDQ